MTKYEYDAEGEVLIKLARGEVPKIMRRRTLTWNVLTGQGLDDRYARAIFLGQGCWEKLDTISEEKAQKVLKSWGYNPENDAQ